MRLLAIYLIISLFFTSCDILENEVFILPNNFTGYILVIFDQKDGKPKMNYGMSRVYEIPASGILRTQFDSKTGWRTFPQFYYGGISDKNKILYCLESDSLNLTSVKAFGGSVGSLNKDLEGNEVIRYCLYYVGNELQIDSAFEAAQKLDIVEIAKSRNIEN
jgi:hypothetical protein